MSQSVTGVGKTIDKAVDSALEKLGLTRDQVEVNVIQQPESGVFGLFGKKDAIVEVFEKEIVIEEPEEVEVIVEKVEPEVGPTKAEKAIEFLEQLFETMGIDCTIEVTEDDDFLRINLVGDKMGILIGRRGQTLDAIQYLTSLAVNKEGEDYQRIIIDTENYRDKRQRTLEDLADKMANKALRYGRRISLEPMNPAERRIIHARLQNNPNVTTYSEGQDPYRYIVIQAQR